MISYLLITCVIVIENLNKFKSYFQALSKSNRILVESFWAMILGIFISLIIAIIFTRKKFSNLMIKVFHKTPNDDIWRDIFDLENGSNLKIYLKSSEYFVVGHYINIEEKGENSWIAVSAYAKYDKNNQAYNNEKTHLDEEECIYTIRLSDIDHIEIF